MSGFVAGFVPRALSVPLSYKVLGVAFQSWGWVQAAAFYGFIPVVLYIGAKNSGFTSITDFKKAFQLPLL